MRIEDFVGVVKDKGYKKVFLSGAITGRLDTYKEHFNKISKILADNGIIHYNPATIDINTSWQDSMKQTIRELTYCDVMYVLEGWGNSEGVALEICIAKALDLDIYYEDGFI